MKNAIILHGTSCTPQMFWYPSLKETLEKKGYRVWTPELPNPKEANLSDWLPFVLENGLFNEDTVLIGHSAGATLILSILENLKIKIKQAILVAGFIETVPSNILQERYDWESIKESVEDIIFINSNNDPYGCDDKQGRKMLENIGGTLIIKKGEGHMGSIRYDQPYKQFPLLSKLVD